MTTFLIVGTAVCVALTVWVVVATVKIERQRRSDKEQQ